MGTTDLSSIWESSERNPCLDKIWRDGKGKGSKIFISSMGRGVLWGGDLQSSGVREVGISGR